MKKSMDGRLRALEERLGYAFRDQTMLCHALTHSSYANEAGLKREENNERLEFLGDAVLECASSDYLYRLPEMMTEGNMTKMRSSLVCESTLADCARALSLGEFVLLGRGESLNGGRNRNSILSDTLEAIIGAIYIDGGFTSAKEFIERKVLSDLEHKELFYDSKTILQEIVQNQYKKTLHYVLLSQEGPEHQSRFLMQAYMDEQPLEKGIGRTKKAAEQAAAYKTILTLQKKDEDR